MLLSNRRKPANLIDVQYSIPYCLGAAAILGSQSLLPIEDDILDRPDVSEFAERVSLHLDPELDRRFPGETLTRVVVRTATGRFESPVTAPRGEASAPLSWDELQDKFLTATRKIMTSDEQHDTLYAVEQLRQGDPSALNRILGRPLPAMRRMRKLQ